ncbi:hypothetical protein [Acaryochloris sp. IP29b_bin.148]|nr:hypothetical protein [Acaryochloris sp. IP29b_bin.148]
MKIKLTALAVLLGFATLLGACQDSASDTPAESPAESPAEAPAESPAN